MRTLAITVLVLAACAAVVSAKDKKKAEITHKVRSTSNGRMRVGRCEPPAERADAHAPRAARRAPRCAVSAFRRAARMRFCLSRRLIAPLHLPPLNGRSSLTSRSTASPRVSNRPLPCVLAAHARSDHARRRAQCRPKPSNTKTTHQQASHNPPHTTSSTRPHRHGPLRQGRAQDGRELPVRVLVFECLCAVSSACCSVLCATKRVCGNPDSSSPPRALTPTHAHQTHTQHHTHNITPQQHHNNTLHHTQGALHRREGRRQERQAAALQGLGLPPRDPAVQ